MENQIDPRKTHSIACFEKHFGPMDDGLRQRVMEREESDAASDMENRFYVALQRSKKGRMAIPKMYEKVG